MVANRKEDAQFIQNVSPRAKLPIYYLLSFIFYLLSLISPSIPHSSALHHTIPLIFGAKIGDNLAFRQLHFARTDRIIEA